MSEKNTQIILRDYLVSCGYNEKYFYYSPTKHKLLKKWFKKCSKKGTDNIGIPDLIYLNEEEKIIIVCANVKFYHQKNVWKI